MSTHLRESSNCKHLYTCAQSNDERDNLCFKKKISSALLRTHKHHHCWTFQTHYHKLDVWRRVIKYRFWNNTQRPCTCVFVCLYTRRSSNCNICRIIHGYLRHVFLNFVMIFAPITVSYLHIYVRISIRVLCVYVYLRIYIITQVKPCKKYTYGHICIYTRTHTCVHVYTNMHTPLSIPATMSHICTHIYIHVCTHICIHKYKYTYTYVCTCTHTWIYIHMYIYVSTPWEFKRKQLHYFFLSYNTSNLHFTTCT